MFLYHPAGAACRCVMCDEYSAHRWLCTSNEGGWPGDHLCGCSRWGSAGRVANLWKLWEGVLVAVSQTKYQNLCVGEVVQVILAVLTKLCLH
jgi:hypothetical protein